MLSPYRVLDLANERGLLCGQILADLGADVIAIEPPGGNPARRLGPFAGDRPDPERSLYWWAYSRDTRSVMLDIASDEGRADLLRLVETADFLVESERPGRMAALGLGYEHLAAVNPELVYVSISAFGQDGPKAGYADSDLIVSAAAGRLAMTRDEDCAPLRISAPQAFLHAGAEAAGAALIAHRERRRSGRGQHVDVSAQQAGIQAARSTMLAAAVGDEETLQRIREGGDRRPPSALGTGLARDGHVSVTFGFGNSLGPFARRLMEWVHEEGFCDEATRDKDWIGYPALLRSGEEPAEEHERVRRVIADFVRTKTKAELLETAFQRRLLIAPMMTTEDVAGSDQLAARDYWRELDHPQLDRSIRYPGPFVKFGETPIQYRTRAPAIGEHNGEHWGGGERESPRGSRPALDQAPDPPADELPLEGLKVLDFMWSMAGPAVTRQLADYGATVVRVESTSRLDITRTVGPYHGGEPGPENSAIFGNLNANKLGITLDLSKAEGRAIAQDLVRWADVVTESFSPKAMPAWGLDYESLRRLKPEIIMLSTCLMGQDGPMAMYAGFGTAGAAVAGFNSVVGWPGRDPASVSAYTDYLSPRFALVAVLAALDHRDRSGQGQYVDCSQVEASLHFLGPAVLDFTVNGRVQGPLGNRDPQMAPHGVYPAAGDDRWVAIAVDGEEQWGALSEVIGRPELVSDQRFATLDARLRHQDELDGIVGEWTRLRDMYEVESALQRRGVPAHAVQHSAEMVADAQLAHRGHFVELEHPLHGSTTVEGAQSRLSRTPARIARSAPTSGRDNDYVLSEILGYDDERLAEVDAAGALD